MRRVMVFATAAVLLLSACGADPRTGSSGASGQTASPTTVADAAAPEALRFVAPSVGGGTLDLSTYAGRTVAFWFWAPT